MLAFLGACLSSIAQTNSFPTTGNVGIGTVTPSGFLNIVGNSGSFPELKVDHYFNNFGASTIQLRKARGTLASPTVVLNADYVGSWETWAYNGTSYIRNSYVGAVVNGTPTTTGVPTDLVFASSLGGPDAMEGMRLDKNGNVGIGTTTPTDKLSVKGKIRAQEIKVETTGWADFVFAKNYKLPSLQATEQHILANGHLPGIPSAEEVAKDGIELGEMNKKLLQKIEELTLYLIEMKKGSDQQQSQIKKLTEQVETIQKTQNLN